MKHLGLIVVCILSFAASLSVRAQNAPSAMKYAEHLASCMKAMDAGCVIRLSDVDSYNRLSSPDFDFPAAQTRFFEAMKREGMKYTLFNVSLPVHEFTIDGRMYAFVPYISKLDRGSTPGSEVTSHFLSISKDGGKSWTFVDFSPLVQENIQQVIPGYNGQPLPPVRQDQPTSN